MIKWKESYNIGIDIIDEQHKELFEIAGRAEELLLLPENIDKFDEIIEIVRELTDYVAFHFSTEQNIMEKIKYPKYFSHRVEHDDFIQKINHMNIGAIDTDQHNQLLFIINLVIDWITEHVLYKDKAMAEYYHQLNEEK